MSDKKSFSDYVKELDKDVTLSWGAGVGWGAGCGSGLGSGVGAGSG